MDTAVIGWSEHFFWAVKIKSGLIYRNEMPKVLHKSRVNLDIRHKSAWLHCEPRLYVHVDLLEWRLLEKRKNSLTYWIDNTKELAILNPSLLAFDK